MFNVQSSTMNSQAWFYRKFVQKNHVRRSNVRGLMSEGLMSEGLMSEGQMSEGLTSDYHHITALKYQEGPRFEPRHFHYF